MAEFHLGLPPEYVGSYSKFEESAIAWTPAARRQLALSGLISVDVVQLLKTRTLALSARPTVDGEVLVIEGATLDGTMLRITIWSGWPIPVIKVLNISTI